MAENRRCEFMINPDKRCSRKVAYKLGCVRYCWQHAERYQKGVECFDGSGKDGSGLPRQQRAPVISPQNAERPQRPAMIRPVISPRITEQQRNAYRINREYSRLKTANTELEQKYSSAMKEISQMRDESLQLKTAQAEIQKEVLELQKQKSDCEEKLRSANTENEKLLREIDNFNKQLFELNTQRVICENDRRILERNVERLEREKEDFDEKVNIRVKEITEPVKNKKELEIELYELLFHVTELSPAESNRLSEVIDLLERMKTQEERDIDKLLQQREHLLQVIKELEAQNTKVAKKLQDALQERNRLEDRVVRMTDMATLDRTIYAGYTDADINRLLDIERQKAREAKEKNQELEAQIQLLQQEMIFGRDEKIQELESRIQLLKQEKKFGRDEKIQELESQIQLLQQEKILARHERIQELESLIQALQHEKVYQKHLKSQAIYELNRLKHELKSEQSKAKLALTKQQEYENRIKTLNDKVSDLNLAIEEKDSVINALEDRHKQYLAITSSAEYKQSIESMSEKDGHIQSLLKEIEFLRLQSETLISQVKKMENEIGEKDRLIQELQKERTKSANDAEISNRLLVRVEEHLDNIIREISEFFRAHSEFLGHEFLLSGPEETNVVLKFQSISKKLLQLSEQLAECEGKNRELIAQISEQNNLIADLKRRLSTCNSDLTSCRANCKSQTEQLKQQLNECRARNVYYLNSDSDKE